MTTIQQAQNFSGVRINPNLAPLPKSIETEQNTTTKLNVHDVNPLITDFTSIGGKPQLATPLAGINYDQMLAQIGELEDPDNAERLDDLRIALSITPEGLKQAITTVIQREVAVTKESAGNRALLDALATDDVEQRHLAVAVQSTLLSSLLKETQVVQSRESSLDNNVESKDSVNQSRYTGIQTSSMMSFLFSMLRQVMAELNISERRINSMFATLSADMTEKAAESTIREGKEIFKGAIMGFSTSMAIVGLGAGFQARGLAKQNQVVNKHLKPANIDRAQVQSLSRNLNKTNLSVKANDTPQLMGVDGKPIKQAAMPNSAEQANASQAEMKSIHEAQSRAELHGQEYDRKTNKYRTNNSIVEQVSRMSDNAGQLTNNSNLVNVKEAEADRMIQNTASEVARGIANDKEKQIEKSQESMKEIRQHISAMRDSTIRTNQSLIKG
ncbi:IpaC/SipC family type III secretion system effector [Yersinia bercovieri]|uniref:IpaC/SipC family type III secretion system effector n=1 Tax=Yersinia bercovieri TaxID=634 RepID=UPI0011AB5539|nr:IpaC/SipC family type III secretion system effector [Yersinia bercovieri]